MFRINQRGVLEPIKFDLDNYTNSFAFNYDPNTLSSEVMGALKEELPQPIYEEIEQINKPRPFDGVTITPGRYNTRAEIWYN